MTRALPHSATGWTLLIVAALVVLSIAAAFVGRTMVRRGLREPFVVSLINRTSDRFVAVIKRPITIAVLDEVADVLRSGHYTRNIASALDENREEIKEMISEKIKQDPTAKAVGYLPFHDRLIAEITETSLRIIFEVLADARTDELVSDLLRDNLDQIRIAVRERNT